MLRKVSVPKLGSLQQPRGRAPDRGEKYATAVATEAGAVWREVWDKARQTGARQRWGLCRPAGAGAGPY